MSNSKIPDKIKKGILNSDKYITINELNKKFNIKRITASNYLSRLKKEGLITRIGRGEYLSIQKSKLKPEFDQQIVELHNLIKKNSPFLEFIIWSIFNFKEFFHNIPVKNYIFIEVEELFELKAIKERLFENNIESIIDPNSKDFEEVSFRKEIPVFLFKRKNLYGTIKMNDLITAISERCILDMYYYITKKHLNYPIEELKAILIKMIQTGEFNFSFAMRYAKIRNL
jgi:DNA-binding Lrp family transcriptional regulator